MPDKFEKKVQNKLHELKINPTGSVWDNVATELDKSKRRRRMFWWSALPVGIAALLGVFYFNYSKAPHTQEIHNTQSETLTVAPKSLQPDTEIENNDATAPIAPTLENGDAESTIAATNDKSISKNSNRRPAAEINNAAVMIDEVAEETAVTPDESDDAIYSIATTEFIRTEIPGWGNIEVEQRLQQQQLLTDINNQPTAKLLHPEAIYIVRKEKPRKWSFGIEAQSGVSFLSTEKMGMNNPPEYLYASPVFDPRNNNQGSMASVPDQTAIYTEPNYHAGISYAIGLNVKRQIGKHWGISSGAKMKHLSIPQKSTTYFRSSNQVLKASSVNRFTFVEFPLLLSYETEIGTLNVNWEGGMIYSRLVAADALQYNSSEKIFYEDNSIFNKNQVGLYGGISIDLLSYKNFSIQGGPYYQYSTNKVGKEGSFDKKHFNAAGIHLRFSLKK